MKDFRTLIILRKGSAFHDRTNDAGQAPQGHSGFRKKIAMINDIAGYGRCSTTVSLPIISAMQVQVCPVPTSIFSNHTGFPVHFMHDCTDILPEYLEKWRELELTFDGIYCGFLGSVTQIGIVKDFLASQTGNAGHSRISADGNRPIVILDPVMGDHGRGLPHHHSAAL